MVSLGRVAPGHLVETDPRSAWAFAPVVGRADVEASTRLVPGVLGNRESPELESFSTGNRGLLEFPQYTRPLESRGRVVPDVLRGGHHAQVERWRAQQALELTRERRPDLLPGASADSVQSEPRPARDGEDDGVGSG